MDRVIHPIPRAAFATVLVSRVRLSPPPDLCRDRQRIDAAAELLADGSASRVEPRRELGLDSHAAPAIGVLLSRVDHVLAQYRMKPTAATAARLASAYITIVSSTLATLPRADQSASTWPALVARARSLRERT